jgi:hypothetical protein
LKEITVGAAMKPKIEFSTELPLNDKRLLRFSVGMFVLVAVFVVGITMSVPPVWRTIGGYCGVVGLFGSPSLLLMGTWDAVRYERTWRSILALGISLIGTILAWGVIVLYAMGRFGFSRS